MEDLTIEEFFEKGEVIPFYQPIKDKEKEEIYKYEVLCRVLIDGEVKNPFKIYDENLPENIYKKITRDIISKLLPILKKNSNLIFSINLTKYDIKDLDHLYKIKDVLLSDNIGQNIIFEITEGEEFKDIKSLNDFISEFKKDLNCKFALDDFGKGYSNILYISEIKFDFIKFDGSLILKISDSRTEQIVNYLSKLFTNLGIEVIAEWVESDEVYKKIEKLNIKYSQGELFGLASENFKV